MTQFKTQDSEFVDMVLTLQLAATNKFPNRRIKHAIQCMRKRMTSPEVLGELNRINNMAFPLGEVVAYKLGMEDELCK